MDLPLLIFSTTRKDSDLRYLAGTNITDDIAVVYTADQTVALASALEINRLEHLSKIDKVIAWEEIKNTLPQDQRSDLAIISKFLEEIGVKKFAVKADFPVYLADNLRHNKFDILVTDQSILPQRLVKNAFEISEIRRCGDIVCNVFSKVEKILSDASVNSHGELVVGDEILTSERMRQLMEDSCYVLGGIAEDTIIACGAASCDPHNIGYGPIRANELIVFDFFPYLKDSGYYADVSRTFIKGRPNDAQKNIYNAVKTAHDVAIQLAKNHAAVRDIMQEVFEIFEARGYVSDKAAHPPHGMIHSLGHGVGLDIHEPPRLGLCDDTLLAGMVVTVEPGLYYPEIGGVRIEDDILIGESSSEVLSHIPYNWIIE